MLHGSERARACTVVLVDALFGPDIAGGSFTRIPSAIVVAFLAYLATRVVARYGFGEPGASPPPEGTADQ